MKDQVGKGKSGCEGGRHESHPRIAAGENVVLFMRRSVVD